jgi:CRISPR-associated protein Csm2
MAFTPSVTENIPLWITKCIDENTINFTSELGQYLANNIYINGKEIRDTALTTSQIRNFFGEIKRIQAKGFEKEKSAFLLLRPKLAYAEARVTSKKRESKIKDFRQNIEKAHLQVVNETHFQNFVNFFEAILAYHKAAGGRD